MTGADAATARLWDLWFAVWADDPDDYYRWQVGVLAERSPA